MKYYRQIQIRRRKLRDCIRLLRPKHWIKNILVLAALTFSRNLFNPLLIHKALWGTVSFCLISSAIYVLNDIRDMESDRQHEIKCMRPIASGAISIPTALILLIVLFAGALVSNYLAVGFRSEPILWILLYFILNLMYSMGLKKVPLLDIAILVSGFLIRVLYGATLINQEVSSWLYLTVISMSFYLGLGKRRNELNKKGENASGVRGVLKYYTHNFLDKNMYMCLALTIVFYALWSVDPLTIAHLSNNALIWTVPLVILICMKYSLNIEGGTYADPVDVLTGDKWLIILVMIYIVIMGVILYGNFNIQNILEVKNQ